MKKSHIIKDVLVMFGYYLLFSIPGARVFLVLKNYSMSLGIFLSYIISMGLTVWAYKRTKNKKYKFNFSVSHLSFFPLVIIVAYAFLVISEFSISLLPEPQWLKESMEKLTQSIEWLMQNKLFAFLTLAVAAPILEEMLFRGILLRNLLKKLSPWKAILLSAFLFGLFHGNPFQLIHGFIIGILLGYLYWKTRSLFYPILVHFILNGTAFFVAAKYGMNPNEEITNFGKDSGYNYILAGIALILIYGIYSIFENYFKKQQYPLVLATQNSHKISEIKKILPKHIALKSLQEIDFEGSLKETKKTLQGNAVQKMRQISIPYDIDAMADDTGLEVEALGGAPGVYSARYAGENATYEDNVQKLLEAMAEEENRNARFRTVIALSYGKDEMTFEGIINGTIAREPKGSNGFGYDSVFIPEGETRTFAQMTDAEKNAISHRAKALKKVKEYFTSI